MPTFPLVAVAPREIGTAVSLKFVDFAGRERSTRFEASDEATVAQINTLRDAVGNASNAALIAQSTINFIEVQNPSGAGVVAFDDAYATAGDVAVMIFTDNNGVEAALEIPAPDSTLFNIADFETVDVTTDPGLAIVTAALAALNAGVVAGTFVYSRGFYSKRKTKRIASRTKPGTFREPTGAELPGAEDGI